LQSPDSIKSAYKLITSNNIDPTEISAISDRLAEKKQAEEMHVLPPKAVNLDTLIILLKIEK